MTAMTAKTAGGSVTTITVRGLDDDVVRALKVRAAREGRSMEAEVRSILVSAAKPENEQTGFGSLLAASFHGVGPVDVPARTSFPEPFPVR